MKTRTPDQNHLIDEGKDNWESTNEYKNKVNEIRRDLSERYSPILLAEMNWFKRLLIRIRCWREMKKKTDEVSSWKNLHLGAQ